jgi:cell division septation protein DedD
MLSLAVMILALSIGAGVAGFSFGRRSMTTDLDAKERKPLLPEEVREGELEVLLARVEQAPDVSIRFTDKLAQSRPELPPVPTAFGKVPADGWAIQVASLADKTAAEALVTQLTTAGLSAYGSPALADGVTTWEVRVGGYPDRDSAAGAQASVARSAQVSSSSILQVR